MIWGTYPQGVTFLFSARPYFLVHSCSICEKGVGVSKPDHYSHILLFCKWYIYACNPAGSVSQSGNMAAVFTLGSLLGLLLLVVIGAVITLGIIVRLCVCHRKQKDTGKSIIYTCYIYIIRYNTGWHSDREECGVHACSCNLSTCTGCMY